MDAIHQEAENTPKVTKLLHGHDFQAGLVYNQMLLLEALQNVVDFNGLHSLMLILVASSLAVSDAPVSLAVDGAR